MQYVPTKTPLRATFMTTPGPQRLAIAIAGMASSRTLCQHSVLLLHACAEGVTWQWLEPDHSGCGARGGAAGSKRMQRLAGDLLVPVYGGRIVRTRYPGVKGKVCYTVLDVRTWQRPDDSLPGTPPQRPRSWRRNTLALCAAKNILTAPHGWERNMVATTWTCRLEWDNRPAGSAARCGLFCSGFL
jgi:hypothetical protein